MSTPSEGRKPRSTISTCRRKPSSVSRTTRALYFIISNGCDALQFDGDGGGQRIDFHRGSARLVVGEKFRVHTVVYREIVLDVGEKNGDIDEVFPGRARVFEDVTDIGEHRPALRFDIVFHDLSVGAEGHSGDFLAPALSGSHTTQEQQISGASGMRIQPHGLGSAGGIVYSFFGFQGIFHVSMPSVNARIRARSFKG